MIGDVAYEVRALMGRAISDPIAAVLPEPWGAVEQPSFAALEAVGVMWVVLDKIDGLYER